MFGFCLGVETIETKPEHLLETNKSEVLCGQQCEYISELGSKSINPFVYTEHRLFEDTCQRGVEDPLEGPVLHDSTQHEGFGRAFYPPTLSNLLLLQSM